MTDSKCLESGHGSTSGLGVLSSIANRDGVLKNLQCLPYAGLRDGIIQLNREITLESRKRVFACCAG
jgi:hypothetical protein